MILSCIDTSDLIGSVLMALGVGVALGVITLHTMSKLASKKD